MLPVTNFRKHVEVRRAVDVYLSKNAIWATESTTILEFLGQFDCPVAMLYMLRH
jgi:hypothetical protein